MSKTKISMSERQFDEVDMLVTEIESFSSHLCESLRKLRLLLARNLAPRARKEYTLSPEERQRRAATLAQARKLRWQTDDDRRPQEDD